MYTIKSTRFLLPSLPKRRQASFSRAITVLIALLPLLTQLPAAAQVAPDARKIAAVAKGSITEARASWWGFDSKDSTGALQAAISSGVPKLVVDKMAGPWIVTPITLVSNQEIVFAEGVVILAKRGEFKSGGASLFTAANRENLTLSGYGATWRMWRDDYANPELYSKAEWRMCLALGGCTNVKILGLTLTESGGDGIYLGVGTGGATNKDILIKDVTCDKNYRQGISVITAENLLIENCTLINTGGTNPRAGIDFEPNHHEECLVNCVMRNCHIENNEGDGIVMYLAPLDATSKDISLRFENCRSVGNRASARFSTRGNTDQAPTGLVEFVNCVFESSQNEAISVTKPAGRTRVRFVDCTIINPGSGSAPIMLSSRQDANAPGGGVEFVNCVIQDAKERNPIAFVDGGGVGLADVRGTLIVDKSGQRKTIELTNEQIAQWMPFLTWKIIPHMDLDGLDLTPLVERADARKYAFGFGNVRNRGRYLLYADKGDNVAFTVDHFQVGNYGGKPIPVVVTAPSGKEIQRVKAPCKQRTAVAFTAPETGVYRVVADPGANRLRITECTNPLNLNGEDGAIRLIHAAGDYYFWVPAGTTEFAVRVGGEGTGERIRAMLIDPDGKIVDKVDNTAAVYQFEVQQPVDTPGRAWIIRLAKPTATAWEDHYLDLRGVPPIVAPSREALLTPVE